jgi:acyl-coenzyme A thioesterase PaaI-like protein
MTMDLYVSCVRSADVGATLRCTAEVTFLGGRTAKVSSRVSQGDGVLCECLSTLYVRRAAQPPRLTVTGDSR